MRKKAVILFALLLTASPCLLIAKSLSDPIPEHIPMQDAMYEIIDPELEETTDTVNDAGETEIEESEAQDEPIESAGEENPEEKREEDTEENPESAPEQIDTLFEKAAASSSSMLSGEAVVYTYQELKSALEGNNGINTVYFGSDITMQIGGIRINPNKRNIIISGLNRHDISRTEPYTLIDYSSSAFTSTIYADTAGIDTLIVRDMNIIGKNYYGPFSVLDAAALAKTIVIYERVNYNGPQLGYHRSGTIRIKDSTVRIHGENGGSVNQEFSEAKHLVFSGKNSIFTNSNAYSIFWHPLGGTFKISDDSSLTVISPDTSALYSVFYADSYIYKVDIDIGERANFDLTISGSVATDIYVTLSRFTVHEAGRFALRTTKAAAATVLRIAGALTVEKEARFMINGYGGASHSLLKQEGGDVKIMKDAFFHVTSLNAYADILNITGHTFICDDPASILLSNANRNITAATNPSRIYINAQQINYWNVQNTGGLDAPALNRWAKRDGSNFIIDGTLATGVKGNFTVITSNYEPGDPPGKAPDATTFNMENARVLAFGRLELTVFQTTVQSTAISGFTKPGAAVRASFLQDGEEHILPDVVADSMGIFHIPLYAALDEGTAVTVKCNWNFLYAENDSKVQYGGGKLEFFVPYSMEFFTTGLSSSEQTINRLQPNWEIIVSDGRDTGGRWSLYARLDSVMTPDRPGLPELGDSLVYVDNFGNPIKMSKETDILIASHMSAFNGETITVSWDEDKGILLSVKPGTAFTDTKYTASIVWTLVDAP